MMKLLDIFGPELEGRAKDDGEKTDGRRGRHPLNPLQQLCVLMAFYSGGSFQRPAGHLFGLTGSGTSKIIRRVAAVIAKHSDAFITMPTTAELQKSADKLYKKFCHISTLT